MRDWRTIRRWVVAACMVIAPVAVAVIRALIPYSSSPSGALAASLAHANLYPVLAVAEVIVVLTMGFAMLGLGRLIQVRAPLLALIGTPIAVLSWILGGGVLGTLDSVTYEMAQLTSAGPITVTILERIMPTRRSASSSGCSSRGTCWARFCLASGYFFRTAFPPGPG
jgi:hypothetical protein